MERGRERPGIVEQATIRQFPGRWFGTPFSLTDKVRHPPKNGAEGNSGDNDGIACAA